MRTNEATAIHHRKALINALGWTILLSCARADDWPQWQGPQRNAISKETGLLKEWPKEGPPLAWKTQKLGGGDSAPSVAAGRIFGMGNRGEDEVVWALSEKDGKDFEQPDRTRLPAWAHPVIANRRLYVRDQDVLLCYDVKAK